MDLPSAGPNRADRHACALYRDARERDTLVSAFLQEGLLEGNKCLALVDESEPTAVRSRAMKGLPRGEPRHVPHLDIERAADVYLRSGRFSSARTTSFLTNSVSGAIGMGFVTLRVVGDMSWLPNPQSLVDCVGYEVAVHRVATQAPAMFLCMYDLHRCSMEVLVEVLRLHTRVLVGTAELVNPYHVRPQSYLGTAEARQAQEGVNRSEYRGSQATDTDRWNSLTESEQRVALCVVDGMTNRQIAAVLVVSRHTVDAHLKHMFVKLDIHSRVQLTVLAMRRSSHL